MGNWDYIIVFFSGTALGGFLLQAFKFFYPDLKNYFLKRIEAKKILLESFDSTMKSADELFGKIESLVKEDFSTFGKQRNSISLDPEHNRTYVLFLFAQFWSKLENIRLKSNYTSIARLKKGKELLRFIETIESRQFRIIDRSKQRIIGESMLISSDKGFEMLPLYSFIEKTHSDEHFAKWINQLNEYISSRKNNKQRQRILIHGVVVAAFLDHFDPKDRISRRREIYLNRLRPESRLKIKNILLGHYLPFIKNKERYYNK